MDHSVWARRQAGPGLVRRYDQLRARAATSPARARSARSLSVAGLVLAREAARRALGLTAFREQLVGAAALADGRVVEVATGEGKTLMLFLAATLRALDRRGVHVVTANPYLAARDVEMLRPAYEALGLRSEALSTADERDARRQAYRTDVTYGTITDFGFDYLRDNLAARPELQVQGELHALLVDEADAVLIDEATTPLLLARRTSSRPHDHLHRMAEVVTELRPVRDYRGNLVAGSVTLTDRGWAEVARRCRFRSGGDGELLADAQRALHAHLGFEELRDYLVEDGQLVLLDRTTGRRIPDRRLAGGLHQALEAKEGLVITPDTCPQDLISVRELVRRYRYVGGTSATVVSEAPELRDTYGLEVVRVPRHRPSRRRELPNLLFTTGFARDEALLDSVLNAHRTGRPVLVSAPSVATAEALSARLKGLGVRHSLLTARQDRHEAAAVGRAGNLFAVTIAAGLAGRGTDIALGRSTSESRTIRELGGLLVVVSGRSTSRRVDDQLVGRTARQGEPGDAQFLLAADDELLVAQVSRELAVVLQAHGGEPRTPLVGNAVDRVVRLAQARADRHRQASRRVQQALDEILSLQSLAHRQSRDELLVRHLSAVAQGLGNAIREQLQDGLPPAPRVRTALASCGPAGLAAAVQDLLDECEVHVMPGLRNSLLDRVDNTWSTHLAASLADVEVARTATWLDGDLVERFRRMANNRYRGFLQHLRRELLGEVISDAESLVLPRRIGARCDSQSTTTPPGQQADSSHSPANQQNQSASE
ncbi:hypothetical protein [Crossiella equi]|uniref:preprotein translocase subunit SecA n=2 Tax=Crossiella equi TaxID=130796 RepID=UPI0020133834|nr:hypothetical protein [Crossiella equi]